MALAVIVVLTGLVLVFAQNIRTEAGASANRATSLQADAIEQGAERWVLDQVEYNIAQAATSGVSPALALQQVPAQALQIGDGYFWVITPNPTTDQQLTFGITDESSKLNLNTVTSTELLNLNPSVTQDIASAIIDWRAGSGGQESGYYAQLPESYVSKGALYETVEELLLVEGVDKKLLFNYDLNRNGMMDASELQAAGGGALFDPARRGLYRFFTVYTIEPNSSVGGGARINIASIDETVAQQLQRMLARYLPAGRPESIVALTGPLVATGGGGRGGRGGGGRGAAAAVPQTYRNLGDFLTRSQMKTDEFKLVVDHLTTNPSKILEGQVSVTTAPLEVLECLPGMTEAYAQSLISARATADTSTIAWIFDALPHNIAGPLSSRVTARSFQYSADIVAVSGDGRSFKRVLIVVDAQTTPAKIVYRRDLTSLGWPLTAEIRTDLKTHQPPPTNGLQLGGGELDLPTQGNQP